MTKLIQLILEDKEKKITGLKKLIEFPEFRQAFTYDCGASAVQAILAFFGIDEREEVLMDELHVDEGRGTNIKFIKSVLENDYNITAKELSHLTIDSLKKLIDKDYPVLMLVQAWPDEKKTSKKEWEEEWEEGHYVIAVGYTDKAIIFEDPSAVVRTYISFDELDKRWHDYDELPNGEEKTYDHWGMIFDSNKKYEYSSKNVTKME